VSVEIKRHTPSVFVPVLLLLAGVLLLLLNLDALPEGAGWRLLLVSPLVLIMLGLQVVINRLLEGQIGTAVSLAVVGVIGLLGVAFVALGPSTGTASYTTTSSSSPVAGLATGTLHIEGAGSRTSVIFGDTGSDLYRARLSYSGAAPQVNYGGGTLRITSESRFLIDWGRSPDQYTLTLSQSVPWSIAIDGAGTTTSIEVLGGRLQAVTLNGVGSDTQLSLGAPQGTVPIEFSGVGSSLTFTVPAGVEYRAATEGIGASLKGVPESPGWSSAADRYDIAGKGVGIRLQAGSH
jgi:hypothetical protein